MNSNLETDVTTIFWKQVENKLTDEFIQSYLLNYFNLMSEFYMNARREIETGVEYDLLDNYRNDEISMQAIKQDIEDNFDTHFINLANEIANDNWDRKKFKDYYAALSFEDILSIDHVVYYSDDIDAFYEPVFIDVFRTQEPQDIRLKSYQETIDFINNPENKCEKNLSDEALNFIKVFWDNEPNGFISFV